MITGRRIAGSLIAAAALSLTLVPLAAAEPKAAPREEAGSRTIDVIAMRTAAPTHDHGPNQGTAVSIVCKATGKPHGKPPHLSLNDLKRVIKLHEVALNPKRLQSCKITSGVPGVRIVRPKGEDAPPSLKEFHK